MSGDSDIVKEDSQAEDAEALFARGVRHATGRDADHDLVRAHQWFNLAAMMGHEEARESRAEVARELTAAQIAEAQRLAREWLWGRAKTADAANQPASAGSAPLTLAPQRETRPDPAPERQPLCA
jgi:hypothetical protein